MNTSRRGTLKSRPETTNQNSPKLNKLDAEAVFGNAVTAYASNNVIRSAELAQHLIRSFPNNGEYQNHLGVSLLRLSDLAAASEAFAKAVAISPCNADWSCNHGLVLEQQGFLVEAASAFRRALRSRPHDATLLNQLGTVLHKQGQYLEAIHYYKKSISYDPQSATAYSNLGSAYRSIEEPELARRSFIRALELDIQSPTSHFNLGNFEYSQGCYERAHEAYVNCLKLQPLHPSASFGVGNTYQRKGLYLQAKQQYEMALSGFAELSERSFTVEETFFNYGALLLLLGHYRQGWSFYNHRKMTLLSNDKALPPEILTLVSWDGTPRPGHAILIYSDEGIGDVIQFIRYVTMMPFPRQSIFMYVQTQLKDLLQLSFPDSTVLGPGEALPTGVLRCSFTDLPSLFRTEIATIPQNVPYLQTSASNRGPNVASCRKRRVGLVWAGSSSTVRHSDRSLSLSVMEPLLKNRSMEYFSLQFGPEALQADRYVNEGLLNSGLDLTGMLKTARALQTMDLLITVDTSLVHLAGALAIPTYLMLPFTPEWRWMLDRKDSPWYPTVKIYRQPSPGDWEAVVTTLSGDLARLFF